MTDKVNTRKLALTLLTEYEELGKYVNLSLASHKLDKLTREERAFVTALLYTTVERKLTYDYYIGAISGRSLDKIDAGVKNILRLGICQLIDMAGVPSFAAVNESVKLARNPGERSFINAVLREVDRQRDALPLPDRYKKPERYLSIAYSFPLWMVKRFVSLLGYEGAEQVLSTFNSAKYTDLTVNTTRISVENFIASLKDAGYVAHTLDFSPLTVRINSSVDPRYLPGYSSGDFFVQDAASAASVGVGKASAGELLIDVCAAPGGKSFNAAIMMGDAGRVKSFDLHESKISLISDGARRLGLSSVSPEVRDGTNPDPSLFGTADVVICDAPCSGLGVLAKKPDIRYRSLDGLDSLPDIQYSILFSAAKYLKPGGRLVYSTCTLNPDENEGVLHRFLESNPDFYAVDFNIGDWESNGGAFTFYPHIHGTDGFFVALLKKREI